MDNAYNAKLKAKGVYEDDVYFPSQAECNLYKILRKYKDQYILTTHESVLVCPQINKRWKIDFTLRPIDTISMNKLVELHTVCTGTRPTGYIHQLHIEYKGYNDKNFRDHMLVAIGCKSDIIPRLILVSDHASAYVCEDIPNRSRTILLINSFHAIQYWMNEIFN